MAAKETQVVDMIVERIVQEFEGLSFTRRKAVPIEQLKRELREFAEEFNLQELKVILMLAEVGDLRPADVERKAGIPHATFYKKIRRELLEKGFVEMEGSYMRLTDKTRGIQAIFR
jgi:hypothetical protein